MAVQKVIELVIQDSDALRKIEQLGLVLSEVQNKADQAADSMNGLVSSVDGATDEVNALGNSVQDVSGDVDELNSSLGNLEGSARAAQQEISSINTTNLEDAASDAGRLAANLKAVSATDLSGIGSISTGIPESGDTASGGIVSSAGVALAASSVAISASVAKVTEGVKGAFASINDYSDALKKAIEIGIEAAKTGRDMTLSLLKVAAGTRDAKEEYLNNSDALFKLNKAEKDLLQIQADRIKNDKNQQVEYQRLLKAIKDIEKAQRSRNETLEDNTEETEQNTRAKKKNAEATEDSTSATGAFKEEADGVFDSFVGGIPLVGSLLLRLKKIILSPVGIVATLIGAILALPAALSASTQEGKHFINGFVTPLKSGLEGILGELQKIANQPGGWKQIWAAILGGVNPATNGATLGIISRLGAAYTIAKQTGGEIAKLTEDLATTEANVITALSKLRLTQSRARVAAEEEELKAGETTQEAIDRRLDALNTYKAASEGIATIERERILQQLKILKLAATLSDTSDEQRADIARKAAELDDALIALDERTREYASLRRTILGFTGPEPAETRDAVPDGGFIGEFAGFNLIETETDDHQKKMLEKDIQYRKQLQKQREKDKANAIAIEKAKNDAILDGAVKVAGAVANAVEAFADEGTDLQKGAAIAGVVIDGAAAGIAAYRAYMGAAAATGGVALPAAKIALAAELTAIALNTAAAIKTISSVNNDNDGGGAGSTGGTVQTTGPDFNIIEANTNNQLAGVVGDLAATPTRAYVVSTDISSQQELDRKIETVASTG